MTSFTKFSAVSDVNVILSEGLFSHVAARIILLLTFNNHFAENQTVWIAHKYCSHNF